MAKIISLFLLLCLQVQAGFYEDAIQYLASDKLEGRRAGTSGNVQATDYSISKFKSYGLEKFAGSYKQDFTIFTEMIKSGDNFLKTSSLTETKFQPISSSLSGNLNELEAVYVGYGISIPKSDPKLKYDDYEGVSV